MRYAILYDILPQTGYRNDGNPLMVWRALKRRQEKGILEIDHLAPNPETIGHFGKYDCYIWVDWGEDGLIQYIPYPLMDAPRPNVTWISDTHLGYDYRLQLARKFDHVFVAQKKAVEDFKKDGVTATWLPHAFEPEAYHDLDTKVDGIPQPFKFASKKYDVSFVGHVNSENREDFLDGMFREFPNFYWGQKRFQDASRIYAQSKIVLNISMKEDLNMRVFEALGSGSFLLTDWVPSIDDLFEDGKHLVLYRSLDEAVDKAKYYLKNDSERDKIAQAGFDEVMKKHTIDHRVDKILEAVQCQV